MKTLVCTLAAGRKIDECDDLITTFKEHTDYDVVVYSDQPERINHTNVIDLNTLENAPLRIETVFNYNLKGIITHHSYFANTHDQIIYLDCDVFIQKPSAVLPTMVDEDAYAVYGQFLKDHLELQAGKKYQRLRPLLGVKEDIFVGMKYLTEAILVFNRNQKVNEFIKLWNDICTLSNTNGLNPCYESVELGFALHMMKNIKLGNLKSSPLRRENSLLLKDRGKVRELISK